MAKYILERNDGTAYELEGPEGASKEDLVRVLEQKLRPQQPSSGSTADRLRALYASRPAYEAPPRESTMGEEFMRTLRGTLSSGRTGLASLVDDENEQARAGLGRSAAIGEDYGVGPSFEKVKETYDEEGLLAAIAEGAGQIPRYIAQQLPTLAQAAAGAKAGAMLTPIPAPQAKAVGAILGAVGAFLPTFAGSNIERRAQEQQEAGQEVDVDVGGAYGTAVAQSALQGVGSAAILGKNIVRGVLGITAKEVPEEVAEKGLRTLAERGYLNNIVRRGAVGAAGEVPTEVAQQMLERSYAGLPLADEEAMAEYGEAAYASALGGGVLGGATGANDRRINQGNLEAFERKKIISDTPVVGADGTVKGRMILTQNPDGSVTRQNIDAKGEVFGTEEYSGEQAANIFAYGKGKERARTPVNENDLVAQGFKKDEKKEETPPAAADQEGVPKEGAAPVKVTDEMEEFLKQFEGMPPEGPTVPVKGGRKPIENEAELRAQINAEAAKQGVTVPAGKLEDLVFFASKRNADTLAEDIAKQVTKNGVPIPGFKPPVDTAVADAKAAADTTVTSPTGTETTPAGTPIKIDQQRDDRIQQEGGAKTAPPVPPAAPLQFGSVPAMKAAARQIATEMGVDISDADIDALVKPVTSKSVTKRESSIRAALEKKATESKTAPTGTTATATPPAAPTAKVETPAAPTAKVETPAVVGVKQITKEEFDAAGVSPTAPIRRIVGNLNLLDPEQAKKAAAKIRSYANHKKVRESDPTGGRTSATLKLADAIEAGTAGVDVEIDDESSPLTSKLIGQVSRKAIPVMKEDFDSVQGTVPDDEKFLDRPGTLSAKDIDDAEAEAAPGKEDFGTYVDFVGGDVAAAVRVLANDLAYLDQKVRTKDKFYYYDESTYKTAKKAEKWVRNNLSKPANAALDTQIKEFEVERRQGIVSYERRVARNDRKPAKPKNKEPGATSTRTETSRPGRTFTPDERAAYESDNLIPLLAAVSNKTSTTPLSANAVDEANSIMEFAFDATPSSMADAASNLDRDETNGGFTRAEAALAREEYLELDAVAASSTPMTEAQIDLANKGDLSGVMQNIENTNDNADVKRLAKALKANIGDTKLEVVDGLIGAGGKQVAGLFDPKTNTIKLNSRVMLRPHTIMHETTHAATSHILKNKSHPVTKALTKLFNDVKAQLDTEYGATSLDEFVAEVFSNVQFRQKLAAIMVAAGDGKQITAFQRFKNVVGNLLRTLMGRPTVSIDRKEDALTQADALIRNILSPAPNVRNAPEMYAMLAEGGKSAEPVMETILAPFRGASTTIDPQALARARTVMSTVMSRTQVEAATYLLPLNAQIELAADIIPSAKGLFPLLQRKKGARDNEMQKVSELKKSLEQPFKGKAKQREIFNHVVAYSTLAKVDPSYSEADAKKKYGKDPEKMAAYYDMVEKYWKKLSPAQQSAYKELRDYYADGYQKIRKLITARIDAMVTDKEQKDKIKLILLKDILEKESIEPYFPLSRSGRFWLEYSGIDPYTGEVKQFKESYDSEVDRNLARDAQRNNTARIAQLRERWKGNEAELKKSLEVESYERRQNVSALEKVPAGFAVRILNELQAMGAPANVQNMITDMLLNAMPENSLARMFNPRAGTMGFKTDALTVLQDRSPSIITQITNLEYDGPLAKQLAQMQEDVKVSDNPHKEAWLESFTKYIDYSRAPFIAPWARRFKSVGFLYTLGFNVSSVLVNMTNPAVVTYPYLGGQFGFDKALKAMAKAHNVYMSAGGKKTKWPYITKRRSAYDFKYMDKLNKSGPDGVDTEIMSAPNLSNIDFSDLSKVPADIRHYAALEEAMRTRGQSNRSMLTEVNEFNGENLYSKIINLSGLMFHQGERMNRNISGIAAYDLKLEQILNGRPVSSATQKEMQDAADYAIEAIELTNSGSMAETAPRVSQSSAGSVLFMYKRFGVSMLYLQFRMLRQALKAGKLNEQERKVARRQILGLFLTSGTIAGIRGMPMVGPIIWLWNMTKDEDEEDADTILQNYVSEGPFNGILNYTFGLDIAPRIGMTDLLFRSLPNERATSLADTAFNMAGPIAGIADRVYDGWKLMREGEIQRGAERMLPAVIANGMKSYRYSDEGANTMRGDPITEDIDPGHIFGQLLGFAPAGYTRQLERNALDKRVDRSISETKTRLLRKYYIAMREFDFNTMMDAQQEMLEFSLEHPEVAITSDTIESSVRQHKITDEMARQLGGITVGRRRFATVMQDRMEDGF